MLIMLGSQWWTCMGSAQVFILGKNFHTLVTQKIAKYLEKCTKILKPQN
jgi:hypothetical protein